MKLHRGKQMECGGLRVLECETCGFTHLFPLPTKEKLRARYATEHFYTADKPQYKSNEMENLEWNRRVNYPLQMAMVIGALKTNGKRLLDVGCGYGFFLDWVRQRGWTCAGIEPSNIQQINTQDEILYPVYLETVENAELPNDEFDVIRLAWVLEHVRNPLVVLRKLCKALAPGGALLVIVPNDGTLVQSAVNAVLSPEKTNYWISDQHINYFNFDTLANLLRRTGFEPGECVSTFPMELFALTKEYNYIGNADAGTRAHNLRKEWELGLSQSEAGLEVLARLQMAWADVGLGRDIVMVAKRKSISDQKSGKTPYES